METGQSHSHAVMREAQAEGSGLGWGRLRGFREQEEVPDPSWTGVRQSLLEGVNPVQSLT